MSIEQQQTRPASPAPDPVEGPPPESPPQTTTPVVVPRGMQMVLLGAGLLALWAAASAARTVILIFTIAALTALIFNPVVSVLHRRPWIPRGLAILLVYVSLMATVGAVGYLLSSPISNQLSAFRKNVPHLVNSANKTLADLQGSLDKQGVHLKLTQQGKTALQTLQGSILKGSGSIVSFSGGLLRNAAGVSLDLILIFVLSVYMLVYGESIGRLVRDVMPPGDGSAVDDFPLRVQRAVSGYIRGQLLFSIIMGTTAGLLLYLYGALGIFPDGRIYAVAFGAFFGAMELVPFIGPILGALPPILVALFTDPLTAVWVGVLFLALQQIEGHIVAPQIFSHALRINPLLVIFALLFGQAVYGLIGALLALPLSAVLRETVLYLRRHVVLERWDTGAARSRQP
ncbi:MAG: AI-2E family transporter [Solirubrobacteraceae bacterium]